MGSAAQPRRASYALLWIPAVLLAASGAAFSLRNQDHAATEPVLHASLSMGKEPRVTIGQLGQEPMDPELRVAALRLALRWEEQGYAVSVPGPPAGSSVNAASRSKGSGRSGSPGNSGNSNPPHLAVSVGRLAPAASGDPELQQRAAASLGLSLRGDTWAAPDGRCWPRASSVLSITLVEGQVESVGRRLRALGLAEELGGDAGPLTLVLGSSEAAGAEVLGALSALAEDRPSWAPKVVLRCGGARVYRADLDRDGFATEQIQSYAAAPFAPEETLGFSALIESAERFSGAIRSLGKRPAAAAPLRVAALAGIDAHLRDGPLQRCGWYDASQHWLVVVPGVAASQDDAVEDFLETELLRAFGRPASPWLLRGLVYVFTGRAGGLSLTEIESKSQPVTYDEVLALRPRRTRLALAPTEARLARAVLAEFNSDVGAAWSARFEADEDMAERLRARWRAGLKKAPVVSLEASPRTWSGGVGVEIQSPARGLGQLGSAALHADFEQLASLGFTSVQLTVHVPVAPPTPAERTSAPFVLRAFGGSVTAEGDGALLVSAAKARALGLSVILAPRFVTSSAGGIGHQQIQGTPERIRLYGDRRALAMEGVAWLAEQAKAEALVMFEPEELPLEIGEHRAAVRRLAEASKLYNRERSARYASPFEGERLVLCRNVAAIERAVAVPDSGSLASIGLDLSLDVAAPPKVLGKLVASAAAAVGGELRTLRLEGFEPLPRGGDEAAEWRAFVPADAVPHGVVLAPWRITAKAQGQAAIPNLRAFSDERLRSLAALLD